MLVYHRTDERAAQAITRHGFRDATGTYGTAREWTGVWVAVPVLEWFDFGGSADMVHVVEIDVPEEAIAACEWLEEGKPYREWLVPAAVLNAYPRRLLTAEETEHRRDEG